MGIIKCCFCGKDMEERFSNDPRPILSERGNRCCDVCNKDIVIPTRKTVWGKESIMRNALLLACDDIVRMSDNVLYPYEMADEYEMEAMKKRERMENNDK